ncbi:MAG: cytochrome C biogenesis protein [Bacteroidetes bacterium HGW-Bacteroidetes-6]|jgi:cytochrome c biogenesis protein CcdA|nr:MAG: cytochrome C biogenesis protein [Bacteroidetes bacterium HGW-Bacteroidetes-6]
MFEFLQSWADNSQMPILSAFALGLMTAISPCPLATNITAIGYISRELSSRRKIFYNGLLYTLGRLISYTGLGVIIFYGASTFKIAKLFSQYGERFLGPLLIVIGIFMTGIIHFRLNRKGGGLSDKVERKAAGGSGWWALVLGIIFALAFCPTSGVFYFLMLIPLTISSPEGLLLPPVFAVATGLPVIIIAWLLAFSVSGVGKFYNRLMVFEKWFRRIAAVIFILVGLYYIWLFWF